MTANEITAKLLIEIPRAFEGARVWRSNRVSAMAIGKGGRLRKVSAGVDGQGDLTGIFPVLRNGVWYGLSLNLEIKAGKDRMRESQKNFQAMILGSYGIYITAHSVEQCMEDLRKWL